MAETSRDRVGHSVEPEETVDAAWIQSHGSDESVRLVELDVSPAAYDAGHIPGAVFWNAYSDLRDQEYKPIEREALEELLSRSGVTPDTTVVFYGYGAALGFWLMKTHGHGSVRMLVGDRGQWEDGGGEWTIAVPNIAATRYSLTDADPRTLSNQAAVEAAVDDPRQVLLDVRSPLEFEGERFWPSGATEDTGRAGHVPGAVNVPIERLREEDDSFRPTEEMRTALQRAAVAPDQHVIVYCTIGNRASQAWFAMRYLLGYPNVSVYYGSWVEWGKSPGTAIE